MKSKILSIILAAMGIMVIAAPISAEVKTAGDTLTAREVFVNLPLKNLDILRRTTRLDMLDYYDVDSIWQAPNGMGGLSSLEKVTPRFLEVKITPVTQMQIMLLPTKRGDITACLYTIGSDNHAADTDVTFLDAEMQPLPTDKYLKMPSIRDFFRVPDKSDMTKVEDIVPFPTIRFSANPRTGDLTANLTVGKFMSQEDYDTIKQWLVPQLTYRWTGSRYQLVK